MNQLIISKGTEPIGKTSLWLRKNFGGYSVIAIPRLRLEHEVALHLAEGASLLLLFRAARCNLDDKNQCFVVLSGTPELFKLGVPVLADVIGFVGEGKPTVRFAELLRQGVAMLKDSV